MPVFDQGYQGYGGERISLSRRWIPLFREEVLPYLRKRRFLLLLGLAFLPWIWGILLTFFHTQLGDSPSVKAFVAELPEVDEALVSTLLGNGYNLFLLTLVTIWVGSGLVARDRKDGTLGVFLGRALSAPAYLWAKGAALGLFLLLFSVVPVLLLCLFQVGLTGDLGWLFAHGRVLWGTFLFALLGCGPLVLFLLALSSLSKNPRLTGLTYFGIVFLGPAASGVLYAVTRLPVVWYPSILTELKTLAVVCLGAEIAGRGGPVLPPGAPLLFFPALAAASLLVLAVRFRGKGVLR
ncbi:MAG: hypothetical protein ACP5VN_02955 [Acidobacteriota bacterium]